MSTFHAVVWIDHQRAQVLHFDTEHVESHKVKAHSHQTRQHGSTVRTEHEFYGAVADALQGSGEVLVVGPGTAHTQFTSYCQKHRPTVASIIVGNEVVDHPSDNQLIAMARRYFLRVDRMNGRPTPS